MRTFIAFEFDSPLKERIATIQDKIRDLSIKGRWTHIDNFHLTLKFLGDTTLEQCSKIDEQISNVLSAANAINLSLDNIGFFSGDADIRVLFLRLKGEIKALQMFNNVIEESMVNLGYAREKRSFNPHITLGRNVILRNNFNSVKEILKEDCNYSFVLNKISFMESKLLDGKRMYTPIKTYLLKG